MKISSRILATGGFAVLALGVTIASFQASAQTPLKTTKTVAPFAQVVTAPPKKPASPFASVMGPQATVATALTTQECKALGGKVGQDTYNLCGGGNICWREDAAGNIHRVCIKEK